MSDRQNPEDLPDERAWNALVAAMTRTGQLPTVNQMHAVLSSIIGDEFASLIPMEVLEFRRALTRETDRGAALFAAAYLETRLGNLLQAYMVESEYTVQKVLTGNGPLATLSARVDVAFLLGLISKSVHRELHLIRKIRNEFAHSPKEASFGNEPMVGRCRQLNPPLAGSSPRARYVQATMSVAAVIDARILMLREGKLQRCKVADETPHLEPGKILPMLDLYATRLTELMLRENSSQILDSICEQSDGQALSNANDGSTT